MQISSKGFTKATLTEYLDALTADIRADGTFGTDFTIKKEGVIDNIFATICNAFISLEDKVAYALKNKNPYEAEGQWQDDLYSLVGLLRNYATHTVVTRNIQGRQGTPIPVNSLVFKTSQGDEFYLNTAVTLDANGSAVGSFTAYESGAIECPTDSDLTLISAPSGVNNVYYATDNITIIGDEYEDDTEFRMRWLATNSVKSTAKTVGGMYSALMPLCGNNPLNLNIRQNRSTQKYDDLALHTMNIVINSGESDETIANAIFNNLTDGVGLDGTTTVTVQDDEGEDLDIKFTRPTSIDIYFNVEVVLKEDYYLFNVADNIKHAIVDNFNYAMGERIVASDFYQYISAIEGIDYISSIKVSDDGITFTATLKMDYDKYGQVALSNVDVSEAD